MAEEIIIQVGDRVYWQEHWENKVFMRRIYKMLLASYNINFHNLW